MSLHLSLFKTSKLLTRKSSLVTIFCNVVYLRKTDCFDQHDELVVYTEIYEMEIDWHEQIFELVLPCDTQVA